MSLSDERVITLLERYYVPVFTSNEDYEPGTGSVPAEERAALDRIRREGYAAKLSVGSVHAYFLAPDGRLLDTMHVATMTPDALAAKLEKLAAELGTVAGPPPAALRPGLPPVPPGTLRLHLTARYLERRDGKLVPVENAGGDWSALPGEDWIVPSAAEQAAWLPPVAMTRGGGVGDSWAVPPGVAWPLLTRFYPPTENNDLSKNREEVATLTATLAPDRPAARSTGRLARLEGWYRLGHPFYHKEDGKVATARVIGYLSFDPARRRFLSLQMVTEGAEYGVPGQRGLPFGVAVRTVR